MRLIAELIEIAKSFVGDYFFAIIVVAMVAKLLFLVSYREYYRSICIGKALKKEIALLRKKHKNNEKAANEEISKLLMNNRYSMFGSYGVMIIDCVFAFLMGNVFMQGLTRLDISSLEEITSFGLLKLYEAPAVSIKTGFFEMSSAVAVSLMLMVLALQIIHDIKIEEVRVVDQETGDRILWCIQAVLCIIRPLATTVFLIGCKIFNLILFFIYSKKKVTLNVDPKIKRK